MAQTDLPPEVAELEGSDEAVVVVNHEGAVVLMTKPAQELFGVDAEDMVGEFVEMLVPEKMRWGHQAYRRGFIAEPRDREMDPGLEPHGERPMDGEQFPVAVRLEPIRSDGKLFIAAHVSLREEEGG